VTQQVEMQTSKGTLRIELDEAKAPESSRNFLEHVRSRYKLSTSVLNEEFIKNLHGKTGIAEEEIKDIVLFIRGMEDLPEVADKQLASFHKQLESFYKKA